jgi:hypothetical protein
MSRISGRETLEHVGERAGRSAAQGPARALRRRGALLTLLVALFLSASPPSALGAVSTHKLIWGPYDAAAFETYADLGAGIYQITINWSRIAPTRPQNPTDPADPAYRWTYPVEVAIENAKKHGIEVALAVTGAPAWANGGRSWRWAPKDPRDFADFLTAASRHWPEIRHWQIWGEPTRRPNFMPLPKDVFGLELTTSEERGPRIYAELLDAAYVALKKVNPANLVIGGNTFTGGDIKPLAYIKALELPNGKPPRMDLFGHNPFGYRRPDLGKDLINPKSGIADFCDLDVLVGYVDRYLSRGGRNQHKLRLFMSEYFVPTDHANTEFNYWVSKRTAANWLRAALRITRTWRRIYTLGWFELLDEKPDGAGTEVNRGLLTYTGRRKPAYYAFKAG